jgi:hypothetical protein
VEEWTSLKIRLSRVRFVGREAGEIAESLERFAEHANAADYSLGRERTRAIIAAYEALREIRDEALF